MLRIGNGRLPGMTNGFQDRACQAVEVDLVCMKLVIANDNALSFSPTPRTSPAKAKKA